MVKLQIIEEETGIKKIIKFKSRGTFYELAAKIKKENFTIPKHFFLISKEDKLPTTGIIEFNQNQQIIIRDADTLEGFGVNFNDITCGHFNLIEVSNEAPDWRVVCNGINLFGNCENKNCKAYNQEVIAQIYNDNYNMTENNGIMKCPMCNNNCTAKTVGFYNCYYNYYGIKYDEDKDQTEKFGIEIPNFSKAVINNNDTVIVNGKEIKVQKTEIGNCSYFSPENGVVQFIELFLQVKKYDFSY